MNLDPQTQEQFLAQIREGVQRGAAADALGLDRPGVREYIASNAEFEQAVLDAEVDATEHVLEALYQAAASGNVAAAKAWLELKHGAAFSENRGRPPNAAPTPPHDPFEDLDNVEVLDPRRRKKA